MKRELFDAIEDNNFSKVALLIKKGIDLGVKYIITSEK